MPLLRSGFTLHTDLLFLFFFFNDTAPTEIYPLSLHDALPIWHPLRPAVPAADRLRSRRGRGRAARGEPLGARLRDPRARHAALSGKPARGARPVALG